MPVVELTLMADYREEVPEHLLAFALQDGSALTFGLYRAAAIGRHVERQWKLNGGIDLDTLVTGLVFESLELKGQDRRKLSEAELFQSAA